MFGVSPPPPLNPPRERGGGGGEGGFDVVIANPPYVRIQTLKQNDPDAVEFYKQNYISAGKGNYDLYVVFVEKGLSLLNDSGHFVYILPHKFFNAKYGEPLRKLISKGRHLSQVVHFGDQQMFDTATTYTCLLFLDKVGQDSFRFVKVDDPVIWHSAGSAEEGFIQNKLVDSSEWNFVVGKGRKLFERLGKIPLKLGDVADIFVGLQTSADNVFILTLTREEEQTLRLKSKVLSADVTIERDLLFPLVSGTDVNRYSSLPNRQFILFPYAIEGQTATLIDFDTISRYFPKTASYLLQNKKLLEDRENGKMRGDKWYGYIYLKNMTRQPHKKLCVPRLVEALYATYDSDGNHFLDNVGLTQLTV
jgi:hypothetical protein